MECSAFLKNTEIRCSRKAVARSIYCWQHKKIYDSKEDEKVVSKKLQNKVLKKNYSPILINDLNNIILEYAYSEFDPVESLRYYELHPEKYSYQQYLKDLHVYEIEVYNIILEEIKTSFYKLSDGIDSLPCVKNKTNIRNQELWFKEQINYIIKEYKSMKLKVPIDRVVNYPIKEILYSSEGCLILPETSSMQVYLPDDKDIIKISIYHKNIYSYGLIFNKKHLDYIGLSFFWKLIYYVLYIAENQRLPYESLNINT